MPAILSQRQKVTKTKSDRQAPLCSAGLGWGRKHLDPHEIKFQGKYDDPTRGLRGIRITYHEAKAAYTCHRCGERMGCAVCLDDIAGLICHQCQDWANELSERVHGRMVKSDDLKAEGLKLVGMIYAGKVNFEEYTKLWNEARAMLRGSANEARDGKDG